MNSRSAWFWAFGAAIMLLALVGYERLFHRPPDGPAFLLPGFVAAEVDAVQVLPPDAPEIRVRRTNGVWEMTRPLAYPAQANSIEALLETLEALVPVTTLSGADLRKGGDDHAAYGLDTPRASLVFSMGGGRQQMLIGSLTAPGDQVFVQVVGREGVSVIDAHALKLIPVSANMWRDTGLFDLDDSSFDSVLVTTGGSVLELKQTAADRSWRIVRPTQARADSRLVEELIQGLRDLSVKRFVPDDPQADRQEWGLQPSDLEIVFAKGTNRVQTLEFGKPVEGATNAIYAIGRVSSTVVVVASDPLQAWQATPNDFRDRQLIKVPRSVTSIEVGNGESFTLVKTTNGVWRIEPLGIAADIGTVHRFIRDLEALRVTQFVKDVVAEPDLPGYGLASPAFRVEIKSEPEVAGPQGPLLALEFGSRQGEAVFVRRVDENAVYALDVSALESIPAAAGHFRELTVWSFTEDQVAAVTVQRGDAAWRLIRNGLNQWSLAPGSQGIVDAFAVEEAVHRLGQLQAVIWTEWDQGDVAKYGLDEDSVSLTVELKDGSRERVRFGFSSPSGHVYASTRLEGGSWVFEFPKDTFDLVEFVLIKPSNLR